MMKLPKDTDTIIHGTTFPRPQGSRLGYFLRYRLNSGELKTSWFPDNHVQLLDDFPEKFYKRFRGIKNVTSAQRVRAWRYEKNAQMRILG